MVEPLHVAYRKRPDGDALDYDRTQNQIRADGEAGRNEADEGALKRAGLLKPDEEYGFPL